MLAAVPTIKAFAPCVAPTGWVAAAAAFWNEGDSIDDRKRNARSAILAENRPGAVSALAVDCSRSGAKPSTAGCRWQSVDCVCACAADHDFNDHCGMPGARRRARATRHDGPPRLIKAGRASGRGPTLPSLNHFSPFALAWLPWPQTGQTQKPQEAHSKDQAQ